eukprot:5549166-Pyramimonas_sp.AAC.1
MGVSWVLHTCISFATLRVNVKAEPFPGSLVTSIFPPCACTSCEDSQRQPSDQNADPIRPPSRLGFEKHNLGFGTLRCLPHLLSAVCTTVLSAVCRTALLSAVWRTLLSAVCRTALLSAVWRTVLSAVCRTALSVVCRTVLSAVCRTALYAVCRTVLSAVCRTVLSAVCRTVLSASGALYSPLRTCFTSVRPRPVPPCSRVSADDTCSNGWKISSRCSSGMPHPLSSTDT